jgi:hypothetical protein
MGTGDSFMVVTTGWFRETVTWKEGKSWEETEKVLLEDS